MKKAKYSGTYKRISESLRTGWRRYAVVGAVVVIGITVIKTSYGILQRRVPDFSEFEGGEARKSAFFDYLLPRVRERNSEILETRRELVSLRAEQETLSRWENRKVSRIASRYDVEDFNPTSVEDWDLLLRRVDIVPPSLALAQAANESAWGTSRFAFEGRNFFGQWCYEPGCGMVPRERPDGASYEVADFDSAQQSVERYIHNLNHHPAYTELRIIREQLRETDDRLSGLELAEGLEEYSERGEKYVEMIREIISFNDLQELDPQA